ncbi:MAG: hypothetical protein U5J82_05260 [Desulfobacterales bacterium]|nr:hypothetical protein [Desulfobacterales bacterium]
MTSCIGQAASMATVPP